jgi:hypothetical protein
LTKEALYVIMRALINLNQKNMVLSRAMAPAIIMASAATTPAMAEESTAASLTPAQACAAAIQTIPTTQGDTVVCGYATTETIQSEDSMDEGNQPFDIATLHITSTRDAVSQTAGDELLLGCLVEEEIRYLGAYDQATGYHNLHQVTNSGALLDATAKSPIPVRLTDAYFGDFGADCISQAGHVTALTDWLEVTQPTENLSAQTHAIQLKYERSLEDASLTVEQLKTILTDLDQIRAKAMENYSDNRKTVQTIDDMVGRMKRLQWTLENL